MTGAMTQVSIDFETSHLVFPILIACVLALLGLAIVIRDRARIAGAGAYWRGILGGMDRGRFFGTLGLTLVYFLLMVPVGRIWPNTGMGFLLCSIPYVLLTGLLFMHDRSLRAMLPVIVMALVAPVLAWWLFTYPFFMTLP